MEKKSKPIKKDNLKWWILFTVIIGTFLGRLDQTIVNLALPKIIQEFNITITSAGWIATAYIIANAIFVPIWGKLGDTLGRKKIYILGFSIFILGSVLAGLAWNLSSMILFRVIQAIASSADYPTAMAIIAVTFREAKERATALGVWSASFAAASVFGPLIGGPLIDNFGWRSVFLINLPIGIIGMYLAIKFINESVSERKTIKFDWFGAATLGIMLATLVWVLESGRDWGWTSLKSSIAYTVILLFAFIFYKIEKGSSDPIVDFKFFKNSIFVGALINNFITFMGLMGAMFLIPVFAQTFLGYNATQTGYLFIPMAFCLVIAAQLGAKLVGKVKSSHVIAVSTLGAAVAIFLLSFIDPRSTALAIIIPMSLMALTLGMGMAQRTSLIAAAVPQEEIGVASSILALARNIAGAFGIAIFATILSSVTEKNILKFAANTVINVKDPAVFKQVAALIILKAQVSAYSTVFVVASVILLLGAIAALFIKVNKNQQAQAHGKAQVNIEMD